jgi:hypothetical protein
VALLPLIKSRVQQLFWGQVDIFGDLAEED